MQSGSSSITRYWLIVLLILTLAGCATYEQRAARIAADHPDWDRNTVDRVAARIVAPGMTQEMVMEALGRKGESVYDQRTGEEAWVYYKEEMVGWSPLWVPIYTVYFKDGKVAATEGDQRYVFPW